MTEFQIKRRGPVQPLPTSTRHGHRLFVVVAIVCVLLGAFLTYRYVSADMVVASTVTYSMPSLPEKRTLAWPSYGQAAIATRDYGVLETHGVIEKHPTASTAKLITMLAVMERKPFELGASGETLVLDQMDVDLYDNYIARNGSNAPVQAGERITQYQAMQGVMLVSSNNLADTLAIWAFGSLDNYRAYATDMIHRYGLKNTVIGGDASGLDPGTQSTAADLAVIAQKALAQPVIASIASQQTATIPVAGQIYNTNFLLGDDGVIGLKTGESVEAGGNFVLAANHTIDGHTQQIIVVIMGAWLSKIAQQDSYGLYLSARENFTYKTLVAKNQPIASYRPAWSKHEYAATAKDDVGAFIWPGQAVKTEVQLADIQPGSAPSATGSVKVIIGTVNRASVVTLASPVDPPSAWWRIVTR
ncbi:D-alanyl-D-alanine carboxypeptidase DacA precursor [compost metagenome]